MEVRYVVGRRMLVGKRVREIGEAIPEAATMPNLETLLHIGDVRIDKGEEYVACRPIKVGQAYRKPGDMLPEAKRWNGLQTMLRLGDLRVATDAEVDRWKAHEAELAKGKRKAG